MLSNKYVAFVLIGIIVLIGYVGRVPEGEKIGRTLLDRKLTTDVWTRDLMRVMALATRDTSYEGYWQINSEPKRDYINLFVASFDQSSRALDPMEEMDQLKENCAYVGPPSTIVCDEALLSSFLVRVGVSDWYKGHSMEKQMLEQVQQAFLYWIVGHEIGHIVKGHKPAHFSDSAFEAMVESSSLSWRQELEADSFAVSQMQHDSALRVGVESMLIDVVNSQIRSKVGSDLPAGVGIIYDYDNEKVVEYLRSGSHPEFVVRAARMLSVSAETSHDSGLGNMVGGFIAHMREGAPVMAGVGR